MFHKNQVKGVMSRQVNKQSSNNNDYYPNINYCTTDSFHAPLDSYEPPAIQKNDKKTDTSEDPTTTNATLSPNIFMVNLCVLFLPKFIS